MIVGKCMRNFFFNLSKITEYNDLLLGSKMKKNLTKVYIKGFIAWKLNILKYLLKSYIHYNSSYLFLLPPVKQICPDFGQLEWYFQHLSPLIFLLPFYIFYWSISNWIDLASKVFLFRSEVSVFILLSSLYLLDWF